MTGRGVDQVLPHPAGRQLFEPYVQNAREYVTLAEAHSGPIPAPVAPAYIWGEALPAFARVRPDVRVINLETSVTASDDYWRGKGINYRMHPENIACLTAARIDVCGLANNHVLDFRYAGLTETLETLARAGLKGTGAGRTLAEATSPAIVSLAGGARTLVFAAGTGTSGIPDEWAARSDRPGVDLLPDLSESTARRFLDRITKIRGPRDIVVASLHWGSNWGYDVPDIHVRFAHWLIDGGVDVVHGHSSHHPRPIEIYRDRPILYGCGDFINDYEGIEGHEQYRGDLVLMYFVAFDTASRRLANLRLVPLQIRRMTLNRTSRADAQWIRNTLERVSTSFGTHIELTAENELSVRW